MSRSTKIYLLVLTLILFGITFQGIAQSFEKLYQEATTLEASLNEKAALIKFQEAQKLQPSNVQLLCKCSELSSRIGNRESNSTIKNRYYSTSLSYAKLALKLNPNNDEVYVAMSIALGRIALSKSGKEKIVTVKEIKQYADKAITINPQNFKAWHILGKWHYEVSNLNIIEKAAVKLFFGGLPASSFANSAKAYEKSKTLNPKFILNLLELAKAYHQLDEDEKAISCLKLINTIPNYTEDDSNIKKTALSFLKEWGG